METEGSTTTGTLRRGAAGLTSPSSTQPAIPSSGNISACSIETATATRVEQKLAWYEANGFVLGERLFTTCDDAQGGLDQARIIAVAKEIEELL